MDETADLTSQGMQMYKDVSAYFLDADLSILGEDEEVY